LSDFVLVALRPCAPGGVFVSPARCRRHTLDHDRGAIDKVTVVAIADATDAASTTPSPRRQRVRVRRSPAFAFSPTAT